MKFVAIWSLLFCFAVGAPLDISFELDSFEDDSFENDSDEIIIIRYEYTPVASQTNQFQNSPTEQQIRYANVNHKSEAGLQSFQTRQNVPTNAFPGGNQVSNNFNSGPNQELGGSGFESIHTPNYGPSQISSGNDVGFGTNEMMSVPLQQKPDFESPSASKFPSHLGMGGGVGFTQTLLSQFGSQQSNGQEFYSGSSGSEQSGPQGFHSGSVGSEPSGPQGFYSGSPGSNNAGIPEKPNGFTAQHTLNIEIHGVPQNSISDFGSTGTQTGGPGDGSISGGSSGAGFGPASQSVFDSSSGVGHQTLSGATFVEQSATEYGSQSGAGFGAQSGAGFGAQSGAGFGAPEQSGAGFGAQSGAGFGAPEQSGAGFGAQSGGGFGAQSGSEFDAL